MALLTQKELEGLRDGKWETQCVSMELSREDGKRKFCGPGSIRQDEEGRLAFTLYDADYRDGVKNFAEDMQGQSSPRPGEFYPKGHYYRLTATNKWGRQWLSVPTVDVDCDYGTGKGAVVTGTVPEMMIEDDLTEIQGKLAELDKDRKEPAPAYEKLHLHYYFFHDFKYPCNTVMKRVTTVGNEEGLPSSSFSVANFEAPNYDFQLLKDKGIIHFLAKSKEPTDSCPDGLDLRFHECLQFVLGRPIHWTMLKVGYGNRETVRVRSKRKLPVAKGAMPPLMFQAPAPCDAAWELFRRYFVFILPYEKTGQWHPVSSRLFTLQHARSYLWNTRMLTTGVEVEGLVDDQYGKKMPPPENIRKSVDEAMRLVQEAFEGSGSPIDQDSLNRIESSLGLLKSKRSARNKLNVLASKGVLRDADMDTWDYVRNKSAHAVRAECDVTQENLDRIHRVTVLFYHLVFDLIGYQGQYTDYGTRGFPERSYPPVLSQDLFEDYCRQNGVECKRIPEKAGERRPDYEINLKGTKVIAEVKQLEKSSEIQKAERDIIEKDSAMVDNSPPGKRVRNHIDSAKGQLKILAKGKHPSILVLYDNSGMLAPLTDYDILTGMYGLQQINFASPKEPGGKLVKTGESFGGKKRMTPIEKTYISAVAMLRRGTPGELSLDVYHNVHADIPLDPRHILPLAGRQFTVKSTDIFGGWLEIVAESPVADEETAEERYRSDVFCVQFPVVKRFVCHYLYYKELHECYKHLDMKSPFWTHTCDAHLLQASILWCGVFGSDGCNDIHWKNLSSTQKKKLQTSFRDKLFADTSFGPDEWDTYWKQMTGFRNRFAAHRELSYEDPVPDFSIALDVAYVYDEWVRELIRPDIFEEPPLRESASALRKSIRPMLRELLEISRRHNETV